MLKDKLMDKGIRLGLDQMRKNPDKGMQMLLGAAKRLSGDQLGTQIQIVSEYVEAPDSPGHIYLERMLTQMDPDVFDTLMVNFFVNANLHGWQKQRALREEHGCNIPWAILLDPTSACNLHCTGCWAADYGNRLNLSFDDIDSIINQGKELGVYLYIYTGGEPLMRKHDLIKLCRKHDDCVFLCFTNATLIDEAFCEDLLEVKNFIPAISVEGNEDTTDSRRGDGTYAKTRHAMDLLKEHGLPFGISCCYTSANVEAVSSTEFYRQMADWGAYFIWYFHYMPVGSDADVALLPTPEQRELMYERVRKLRAEEPLFSMDFQNDGEFTQGCIAGGRRYLHINARGDVDPCVFIHFSDSNIHEKSLLECLKAPLFMAYHDGQPFNDNMLRPCPMLENPEKLGQMIQCTGAHSSNLEGTETTEELCERCSAYAEAWKPHAEQIWAEHPHIVEFSR